MADNKSSVNIMRFKGFDDLKIDFEDIIKKHTKELANEIKLDSINHFGSNSKYAKGWTFKMVKPRKGKAYGIVFNKFFPSLAGWLEFGHSIWNSKKGKRTTPIEHITPHYKTQKEKFIKDMEKAKIKEKG